jgi:hypothetical protein
MVKFWILTIGIFSIITFFLQKAFYKHVKGDKAKGKKLWSIYHWEGLVALSSGLTFVLLFILKSVNLLSF